MLLSTQFYNNQSLPDESYYQPLGTANGTTYITSVPKPVGQTSSVYVNCSLCQESIIGSQQSNVLCWIPSNIIIKNGCSGDATHKNKPVFYAPYHSRVWQPVAGKYIQTISISYTLSDGTIMPFQNADFSTVVMIIRPII